MQTFIRRLARLTLVSTLGGMILVGGCVGDMQREFEVLFAGAANPTLIRDSVIGQVLGFEFLDFFANFW